MKDSTKHRVKRSNIAADGKKSGVGDKGLATAPMIRPSPSKCRNTPSHEQPAAPALSQKQGLAPESAQRFHSDTRVQLSNVSVTLVRGDDDLLYYRFYAEGRHALIPAPEVITNDSRVFGELAKIDVLATLPEQKRLIKALIAGAQVEDGSKVVTRLGYEDADIPRYFVYGDGSIISPVEVSNIYPLVGSNKVFASKGRFQAYEFFVSAALRNQSIPITVFFFALSEVIKPFAVAAGLNVENKIMELVGGSTNYKSALTSIVAASAWGFATQQDGYAKRWNMTDNKIEEYFRDYNSHLLVLDEATLASKDVHKRGEMIANVVHRVSSGQGRGRSGVEDRGHSVTVLSNSNQPIRSLLPPEQDVIDALEVRLISFQMPQRANGFFDTIPLNSDAVGTAMGRVFRTVQKHHGLAARRLIRKLLNLAISDKAHLQNIIEKAVAKFLKAAGMISADVGTLDHRRIQPFALAYATAVVSFKTGAFHKQRWGKVRRSILRAWTDHASLGRETSQDSHLHSYMTDSGNSFVDCRSGSKPEISDGTFGKLAGFFITGRDGRLYLAVPASQVESMGLSKAALKTWKSKGLLRADSGGLQTKLRLRKVKGQEKQDAFYRFLLAAVPDKVKLLE
ncbi:DUF927 domain-containing protein [Aliirhizobium smilacinae]|uniref:DUF927 domain-containing protein n=1 Tax=Aliirhizobium smilacinae TaxID=1395944 RepID=A0A5C4XRK0_9HYPH|nr:DUF927 domain-containing protein [Rhizobium smilacinae]TNM66216.1 DUF927 domain-containing protein [Rhizobium smilacinae]